MKKQVVYSKFVPRLFSTTLDLAVLSLALSPIMQIIAKWCFIFFFGEFFINSGIDLQDAGAVAMGTATQEFTEYLTLGSVLKYVLTLMVINGFFMGFYFVGFWHYFGATPGKLIMRMRIVDSDSFERPSLGHLIKRFLYYITAFVGIWSIAISQRGQALHDKASRTVVVKV